MSTLEIVDEALRCLWNGVEAWRFPLSDLRLIGEYTNENGPADDWFYVFLAGRPPGAYEAVVESGTLAIPGVGPVQPALVSSTTFASRVIWPPALAGHPLLTFAPMRKRRAPWFWVMDWIFPRVRLDFTAEVMRHVGADPEGEQPLWRNG